MNGAKVAAWALLILVTGPIGLLLLVAWVALRAIGVRPWRH